MARDDCEQTSAVLDGELRVVFQDVTFDTTAVSVEASGQCFPDSGGRCLQDCSILFSILTMEPERMLPVVQGGEGIAAISFRPNLGASAQPLNVNVSTGAYPGCE